MTTRTALTAASVTLFRVSTNTLLLVLGNGIKGKYQGGDIIFELCKSEAEDICNISYIGVHAALNETRKHIIILQQPYKNLKEDQEETLIADLLIFRHHNEETIIRNRDDLYKLYKHRNKLLSQQQ